MIKLASGQQNLTLCGQIQKRLFRFQKFKSSNNKNISILQINKIKLTKNHFKGECLNLKERKIENLRHPRILSVQ